MGEPGERFLRCFALPRLGIVPGVERCPLTVRALYFQQKRLVLDSSLREPAAELALQAVRVATSVRDLAATIGRLQSVALDLPR